MKNYSLNNSEIYRQLQFSKKLEKIVSDINPQMDLVSEDFLTESISVIKTRINQITKNAVLDELYMGKYILVNSKSVKIPNFINTINVNDGKVILNLTPYIKGRNNITPNTLFGILQSGFISNHIKDNPNKIRNNVKLLKSASLIYSRLTSKVIDKVYATNINKGDSDLVSFMFAKFFLINMVGRIDNDSLNEIAYKSCHNETDKNEIIQKSREFDQSVAFTNIFALFKELNKHSSFNKFSVRTFIENFTKMYGETTILAIDHLPSFFIMVFSAYVNAGTNKDFIILNAINDKVIIDCYKNFI